MPSGLFVRISLSSIILLPEPQTAPVIEPCPHCLFIPTSPTLQWASGSRTRSQSPPRSFIRRGSVFRRAPLIMPSHPNTARCTGNSQVNTPKMKQVSTKTTTPTNKSPPGNPRLTNVRNASGSRGCSQKTERSCLSPRRKALSPGSAGGNGGGANTASRSPKRTRRHRGAYLQALSEVS